ncbi:MAG: acyltransferase [Bacteroidaceae bacterium]|nr:acyltransferase [Bacteroidaceae bacterium]
MLMNKINNNIGWIDILRITACFLVVFSHSCDAFIADFNNEDSFITGVFFGSLVRPCVPLFTMMTAVLLLPIKHNATLGQFYKKRIGRIATPLIFWSLLLPLMAFCYFNYVNPETTNPQLSVDDYTASSLVQRLYTFVFNFNFDTIPLWYLYMLIGLYLIMPILNAWLVQAQQKDIKTVLMVWGVSLFLPYVKMFAPMLGYQGNYGHLGLLGECDWNVYGTFYYLSGFVGYLILAYYLKKYPLSWNWSKTLLICVPLFVVGYLITSLGYVITNEYYPGNYAYLEIVWYFSGINVFMMTFPIFVIIQKLAPPSKPILSKIASLTFGVYLCHFTFTFLSYDIYNIPTLPYLVRIILSAITTFTIAITLVWVLSKFRLTEKLIK